MRHGFVLSARGDHRRARAANLREILAGRALPVEDDAVAARERTEGVRGIGPTGQCPAARTAAAARATDARGRRASRVDELVGLEDAVAGALEIGDGQAAV